MKQLFSIPLNGYFLWRTSRTTSLKHCLSLSRRYFSAFKAVQEIHKDMYSKPVLDSKKLENVHLRKSFSSNDEQPVVLMDFDVWMNPSLFQLLRDFFCLLSLDRELQDFSVSQFLVGSAEALQVVTNLLSQFRFPELNGLLTPECLKELEKNLKRWTKVDASVLSFEPKQLIRKTACDYQIFSDEKNEGKKFAEIRVIYYIWMEPSSRFEKSTLLPTNKGSRIFKPGIFAVYNCKFIREITSGFNNQWIMNKINLKLA